MRRSAAVWLAAVAIVVTVALLLAAPWRHLPVGPLGADPGAPNRLTFDVEAGRSFSYGLVVVENRSELTARITGVELVDEVGSLTLVSVSVRRLRDAQEHGLVANDRTFPPPALVSALRPGIGALIEPFRTPLDGVELILELRAAGAGVHGFDAVAVAYRLGDRAYRAIFPSSLRVCATPQGSCTLEPSTGSVY